MLDRLALRLGVCSAVRLAVMAITARVIFRALVLLTLGLLVVYYLMILVPHTKNYSLPALTENLGENGTMLATKSNQLPTEDNQSDEYVDYDANAQEYNISNTEDDRKQSASTDVDWKRRMEQRFANRRATLKAVCDKYRSQMKFHILLGSFGHFLYNAKYNLMVCPVAKVSEIIILCVLPATTISALFRQQH